MSSCCGSEMLLTIANIRNQSTKVLNVPMLFCLSCDHVMVHPEVELEYELLKEYAITDRTGEVDLHPHLSKKKQDELYDPRNQADYYRLEDKLKEHIDRTLDLYSMVQSVDDPGWKEDVRNRLQNLQKKSQRLRK